MILLDELYFILFIEQNFDCIINRVTTIGLILSNQFARFHRATFVLLKLLSIFFAKLIYEICYDIRLNRSLFSDLNFINFFKRIKQSTMIVNKLQKKKIRTLNT